jgi:hypothetical protein
MAVANTLAYYNMATITALNSFITETLGACTTKLSTPVNNSLPQQARVFLTVCPFHPSLILL